MLNDVIINYEVIKGLMKSSLPDYDFKDGDKCAEFDKNGDKWHLMLVDGVFGQSILYHNRNIMANIGIEGDKLIFVCNRGYVVELCVDLFDQVGSFIKQSINYLLSVEHYPACS